jgi:hypothetical protein
MSESGIVLHMSNGETVDIKDWSNVEAIRKFLSNPKNRWIQFDKVTIMADHIVWMEEK